MHAQTPPPHEIAEIDNVWIAMSDGCRLAARVWLPADAEQHPVPAVLEYVPYRKDDGTAHDDATRHPYFAQHGYAAVRVDLRGTGDSEGVCLGEYLPQEHDDALDVLAWLAKQSWCTGDVGMIGYSWGGFNGLQVASHRPPQLKAVITLCSTDDRYRDDCHYMGGCLLGSDMLKWGSTMLAYNARPPDPRFVGDQWRQLWLERLERTPPYVADWIAHQRRDAFWKHGSVTEDYWAIDCAVLAVGGWADAYTNAVPRLLENLSCPRRGIIGPWGHMFPDRGVPGPAVDFVAECVRWWDRWLKGIDAGVMDEPLLRVWMQESVPPATSYSGRPGRWITEDSWPPVSVQPTALDLTAAGALQPPGADVGTGTATAEESSDHALAICTPQTCGQTAGVWCANGLADELAGDQRPDDDRSLTFTSEPLAAPFEILGVPEARLTIESDRPQALVAARLCDVDPSGASTLVTWGQLNLTRRRSDETPTLLEPDQRYAVVVSLNAAGHRFAAGHRLRLSLSPTYWPHAWPSPEAVTLRVHVGGASTLLLPERRSPSTEVQRHWFGPPSPVDSAWIPGPEAHARDRQLVEDPSSGIVTIVDREHHHARFDETEGESGFSATDEYSITEDDPLSARVACRRVATFRRADWTWEVRTTSTMTADAHYFHVVNELEALDDGHRIFGRRWEHDIARDMT
jgi:putative CocE/NonD family hydrolase